MAHKNRNNVKVSVRKFLSHCTDFPLATNHALASTGKKTWKHVYLTRALHTNSRKHIQLIDLVILIHFLVHLKRLPLSVFETETAECYCAHSKRRHLGEWSIVFPGSKGSDAAFAYLENPYIWYAYFGKPRSQNSQNKLGLLLINRSRGASRIFFFLGGW